MQRLTPVFLLVVAFSAHVGQPRSVSASPGQERLIVRPRRIVLVRSAKLAKQFPDKKTAAVTYPVISGLKDRAVLRRIRSLLNLKNIFDYSLQDYRDDAWLSEFGYDVNYNRNFLFDITFTQSGAGAYPDVHSKHLLINLKDGRIIKASDAFFADKLGVLAALVDQKLQAELKDMARQEKLTSDLDESESQLMVEARDQLRFGPENLEDFSVNAKGLTFLYDAGLPHAIQAFEPEGRYFFSYSELKPYLNPSGPLGQFLR